MIAHLITLSNALAALSSALAAYFWYQASQVQAPPKILMGGSSWYHPELNPQNASIDATPLVEFAKESGRRNKVAALWSMSAAIFAFLGWALGAWVSWTSVAPLSGQLSSSTRGHVPRT
jgi:hypothetical protein